MHDWTVSVTVSRPGPLDSYGDRGPAVEHELDGALFDPGSSLNDVDRNDLPEEAAKLFFPEQTELDIRSTDTVSFTSLGRDYGYTVSGAPLVFPMGTQVILRG